jgi:hypothetical protein
MRVFNFGAKKYWGTLSDVMLTSVCIWCCCKCEIKLVGLEVLTAASMKMAVFWIVAPCSLVEVYRHFIGACCVHHQGTSPWYFYQTTWCNSPEDSHLEIQSYHVDAFTGSPKKGCSKLCTNKSMTMWKFEYMILHMQVYLSNNRQMLVGWWLFFKITVRLQTM